MSQANPVSVVQSAYQRFSTGDLEGLMSQFDDAIEWHVPPVANARISGTHTGLDSVRGFFGVLAEDQESVSFEPRQFIAEGDTVITLGHYVWRVRSTGKQFESDFAHVFHVKDGRIDSFHEYTDTAAASAAYHD